MATYLVTGGAGFIGSNIVKALSGRGEKVRVIDNLSTGKVENLDWADGDVDFMKGDICDLQTVEKAMQDVDFVIHLAALPSVPRSIADPIASNRVNVEGTLNVLVAARDAKVRKYVMASSSSVYGDTPTLPKSEDMTASPQSPYAISKFAGERYAMNFQKIYGLPTIALRYFNVFGPQQDPNSQYSAVIPKFIKAMLHGEAPTIHGDGEQSRDFTYIENVIEANILACNSEAAGEFMNAACGDRFTLNELVQKLENILGKSANAVYQETRTGDVKHSQAAIEKAKNLIGFEPVVTFDEGLQKTVDWYQRLELAAAA